MFDSSAIPPGSGAWHNQNFDAIIVPDQWLVDVYRNSGITIPIFVLPCPIYLEEFFKQPIKPLRPNQPFVFGSSGSFVPRKNHIKILHAFIQEFGNSPHVKLKLHGRWGSEDQALQELVRQTGATNVEIINKTFTQNEYVDFLTSLNCYVFLSKGEGYSITPREALACNIPCILTNNTAHTTLCNSGFVRSVSSGILEPSHYCSECGYFFDCTIDDAREALRDVYYNYEAHVKIAQKGRKWVRQYDYKNLKPYYISLAKPKRVILGSENKIGMDFIMTDSLALFNKYQELLK